MIVQFKPKSKTNRVEALMKGEIQVFECNECHGEFEVYFDKKPDRCPICNLPINWQDSNLEDEEYVRPK